MFFADEFVGVSDSKEQLQKLIDVVYSYCNKWRLKTIGFRARARAMFSMSEKHDYNVMTHPSLSLNRGSGRFYWV